MRPPEHFARFVLEVATRLDGVTLICWEQGPPGTHASLIWPEMQDAHWREGVMGHIDKRLLKEPVFLEPSAERDTWVFMCDRRR